MDESWNISGLILEGICGAGKSTVFREIQKSDRFTQRPFSSAILLSEHHTQRVLERKEREEGLLVSDNLSLLDQHCSYLEDLNARLDQMPWCENGRTNMCLLYLFERFHFTHVYHYADMSWSAVQEIDARLARLNCKVCLLIIDESVLVDRIIHSRDAAWREYLSRYGETEEEIVRHHVLQQETLLDLCSQSKLETLALDSSNVDVQDTVAQVIDFWGVDDG